MYMCEFVFAHVCVCITFMYFHVMQLLCRAVWCMHEREYVCVCVRTCVCAYTHTLNKKDVAQRVDLSEKKMTALAEPLTRAEVRE
mmetsp:Transcript_92262/g.134876  ORF Transcript_92262/g.134876 Transcript_92262/m.134876 type:complete len:85 (-) Transcript_92262:89-343(-)